MNKVTIAIQARTGSSRLPGKVLKKIHKNKSLFECIHNQMSKAKIMTEIALCTSDSSGESELVALADSLGIKAVTGPVDDIITRLYNVVTKTQCDYLVRIWGDCPFACPDVVDEMFKKMKNQNWDYITNGDFYTRTFPPGLDVEIYSKELLKRMNDDVLDVKEREFPVEYIRKNLSLNNNFGFWNINENFSHVHLTIDYPQDFEAGISLLNHLLREQDSFVSEDIYQLIRLESPLLKAFSKERRNIEYVDYIKA